MIYISTFSRTPVDDIDALCMAHDKCYDDIGVSWCGISFGGLNVVCIVRIYQLPDMAGTL